MQQIKLTKRDLRNWLAGLIAVPVGLFILGLSIGLNIAGSSPSYEPTVVSTAPMTLPVRTLPTAGIEVPAEVELVQLDETPRPRLAEVNLSAFEEPEENITELPQDPEQVSSADLEEAIVAAFEESVANAQTAEKVASGNESLASKLMMPERVIHESVYTVQVGSFSNRANADSFRKQLSKKGYPVNELYTDTRPPNVTTYKVRIGEYLSREEASHAASRYQKNEQAPVFIVTPPQENVSDTSI